MYKKIVGLMLLIGMLLLNSCSPGGSRTALLDNDNSEEIANTRIEEIINALESRDKDALKAMFSKQALSESDDFDSNVEDLFDFIKGKDVSWEELDGPTVFESNDHGHITKEVSSYHYVNTDKQKYFILLRDYPTDMDHPENVGLYLLLAVKAEDEEKIYDGNLKILYDGNQKITHAGIYLPLR